MRTKIGITKPSKPKGANWTTLTRMLFDQGYDRSGICKELHISPKQYYTYFSTPDLFRGSQMKILAFMTHRPLGHIINLCIGVSSKSVHWFDENSLSVESEIKQIKSKAGKDEKK